MLEGFTTVTQAFVLPGAPMSEFGVIGAGVAVVLLLVLELFVVQWLWNNVLVRVTTFVKPLPSLLYTLGLLILVQIILHSC